MKSEGTVAEVLAGEARFAVVCGDAVEVLRTLPDGCAHVAYCDPPYGLSAQNTADVAECLRAWLDGRVYTHGSVREGKKHCAAHILRVAIVGDANDAEPESAEEFVASGVGGGGTTASVAFSVDLHCRAVLREEEVDAERAVASVNNLLVDEGDAQGDEALANAEFALWPRKGFPGCVGACSCASQGDDSLVRVDVWLRHDPPTDSERATGVVALTGAERRAVLALDLRGRTARILPAEGASDDSRRFLLLPTKHVGAPRGARRLPTELQAPGASGVGSTADLTLHLDGVVDPTGCVGARAGASDDPGFRGVEQTPARCTVLLHSSIYSRLANPIKSRGGMMGHEWDSFVPGPEAWREVHRALRPGGYCVAYSSTRTVDLLGIAVRLAGFEMREGWAWVFGSGFPKSLDVSKAIDAAEGAERELVGENPRAAQQTPKRDDTALGKFGGASPFITAPATEAAAQWSGYGTTTKPCFEPLIVARKPLDGTVAHNVTTHGCGALNIDAARIGTTDTRATSGAHCFGGRERECNLYDRGDGKTPDGRDLAKVLARHEEGRGHVSGSASGRFPAALALVHSEGCEMVGTRRVASQSRFDGGGPRVNSVYGTDGRPRDPAGYADADGMASCDEWVCEPGCAVAELARQSGERTSGAKVGGAYGRSDGVHGGGQRRDGEACYADTGTAARFFFQAKAAASDRLAYVTCAPGCAAHETVIGAREARASATCPTCGGARTKHEHSTVKALDLARYHARLLSLPAHVEPLALVPYCGSGPEARALLEVGFRVIAVDLDPRHCAMTRHRLSQPLEAPQPKRAKRPRPSPTEAPSQPLAAPVAPAVVAEAPTPVAAATKPARGRSVAGQLSLWGVQ